MNTAIDDVWAEMARIQLRPVNYASSEYLLESEMEVVKAELSSLPRYAGRIDWAAFDSIIVMHIMMTNQNLNSEPGSEVAADRWTQVATQADRLGKSIKALFDLGKRAPLGESSRLLALHENLEELTEFARAVAKEERNLKVPASRLNFNKAALYIALLCIWKNLGGNITDGYRDGEGAGSLIRYLEACLTAAVRAVNGKLPTRNAIRDEIKKCRETSTSRAFPEVWRTLTSSLGNSHGK